MSDDKRLDTTDPQTLFMDEPTGRAGGVAIFPCAKAPDMRAATAKMEPYIV